MHATAPQVGQTRAGRIGEADHTPAGGSGAAFTPAANPRQFIEETVRGAKVVIFSKIICPSCRKAKQIMSKYLSAGQVVVVELDQRPDGDQLQDAMEQITGKRSVPNIFINGSFIGGADDLSELESSGQLATRLA